jgi:hypothetical protein
MPDKPFSPTVAAISPFAEPAAPGASTFRWCTYCEQDVDAQGKGNCPACGRFLPGNVEAMTHGQRRAGPLPKERESRRAELRKKVWADLGGDVPTIIAEVAEDFVSACVMRDQLVDYLEDVGALTQRGARRNAMDLYLATSARIERLSVQLGAFKDAKPARPSPPLLPGAENMPIPALELAHALLMRIKAGEVLTEREQGQLDVLRAAMYGKVALPAEFPTDGTPLQRSKET